MALESATYPNQLVQTNPLGTDTKSQGDDHIRLLKKVIQSTFPNITGAVTVTQDQLNRLADSTVFTFPGMIVMWSGTIGSIPVGWALCNGVGVIAGGAPVPNLRDRFIIGAGAGQAVGAVGGTAGHTHVLQIDATALTADMLPPHNHTLLFKATTFDGGSSGHSAYVPEYSPGARPSELRTTSTTGVGTPHTHSGRTVFDSPVNNIPPFYALAFIIKTGL